MYNKEEVLSILITDIVKQLSTGDSLVEVSTSVRVKRGLQKLLEKKYKDPQIQVLYESILSYSLEAERTCPDAGIEFLRILCGIPGIKEKKISNLSDVKKLFENKGFSSRIQEILIQVITNSTLTTNLSIRKSANWKTYIDINPGFSFSIKPLLKCESKILQKPKVICIDGYIESVSEIHHILSYFSDNPSPALIFSRGMNDDVLHTIKVNNDRGTLDIHPFIVPFDLDSANTIVDIAVVAGTDVTSSLKGDLISSIDMKNVGMFESCTIFGGELKVKNSDINKRIQNHIKNLKESIINKPEVEEILSRRLKSLSANCIDIALPDDMNYYSDSQQLDEGIRSLTAIYNNTYEPHMIACAYVDKFNVIFKDTIFIDLQ